MANASHDFSETDSASPALSEMNPKDVQEHVQEDLPPAHACVVAYQDVWYRFCLAQLRSPDLAREATQETALRVIRKFDDFQAQSQLKTWTLGIALNVCRELQRQEQKQRQAKTNPDAIANLKLTNDETPSQQLEAREQQQQAQQQLDDLLNQLTDKQREIVLLRYFEELDTQSIAAATQSKPGTVKATLHQALKKLRNLAGKTQA